MSVATQKHNIKEGIGAILLFTIPVVGFEYMCNNFFYLDFMKKFYSFYYETDKIVWYLIRFLFVGLVFAYCSVSPGIKFTEGIDPEKKSKYWISSIIINILIIVGYVNILYYDIILIFILFIITIPITARATAPSKKKLDIDEKVFGNSNKDSNFYFIHKTDTTPIKIHMPNMNIYTLGGPGTGKSNLIMSRLAQCVERGYPAFVYDYKGDFTKKKEPELTKVLYSAYAQRRRVDPTFKHKFGILNFVDAAYSNRFDLLFYKNTHAEIESLVELLNNNLQGKDAKSDFWQKYGLIYSKLCFHISKRNNLTSAHAVSLINSKTRDVLNFAKTDRELKKIGGALIEAYEDNAETTAVGGSVTGKTPYSGLQNKDIFWILSGNDFHMDINHPERLAYLSFCNAERSKNYTTPIIAALTDCLMNEVNQPDRNSMYFCIDEVDTMRVENLKTFMATARGRGVCTDLGVQVFSQLEDEHKEKRAKTIRNLCGNQFIFQIGMDEAKFYSDFFGEIKVKQTTDGMSLGTSENINLNNSIRKDKLIQSREIGGMPIGHAIGRIADGNPPYFNAQFEKFTIELEEIPPFSFPVVFTKNNNQQLIERQKELLSHRIKENYNQIENDVEKLLLGQKQEYMESKERITLITKAVEEGLKGINEEERRAKEAMKEREKREIDRAKEDENKRVTFIKKQEKSELDSAESQEHVEDIIEKYRVKYDEFTIILEKKINEIHNNYNEQLTQLKKHYCDRREVLENQSNKEIKNIKSQKGTVNEKVS